MPSLDLLIKPASELCNLRCRYCFYTDVTNCRTEESFGLMSEDTLEALVRSALSYADLSCSFAFQGGEPTLVGLDFYRKLIELQTQYRQGTTVISNSIQTNGLVIDEEWARFLAEHHFLVGLSLDGPREIHNKNRQDPSGHGSFDRVMKAVKLFRKYGVEFNILTVVNRQVAEHPKKVYSFLRSQNFRYLQFIECLDPFDGQPEEYSLTPKALEVFLKQTFDEYYADFRRGQYISVRGFDNYIGTLLGRAPEACGQIGHCTAYQVIEANGNVYPCDFYVLDDYCMGNIHTHSFAQLSRSPIAQEFVRASLPVDPACRTCRWYALCRGGCRRCREPFTDGYPGLNRFCTAYKGFFEYAYPRMQGMARSIQMGYTHE